MGNVSHSQTKKLGNETDARLDVREYEDGWDLFTPEQY